MSLHIYPELEQRSPEWFAARCGILTASAIGRMVTLGPPDAVTVACPACEARPNNPCVSQSRKEPTAIKSLHPARNEHAAGRAPVFSVAENETSRGLTETLIAERITGWAEDLPMNSDMFRGIDAEPYARDLYGLHYSPAREVGFMLREESGWRLGYSPDGLVGDDGLIEIKAPRAKNHLRTILADEVPAQYMPQLQAGLLVSGRKWIDFVSYVGGMPLYVRRVTPDQDWFDAITAACIAFETTAAWVVSDYTVRVNGLPETERISLDNLGLVF